MTDTKVRIDLQCLNGLAVELARLCNGFIDNDYYRDAREVEEFDQSLTIIHNALNCEIGTCRENIGAYIQKVKAKQTRDF